MSDGESVADVAATMASVAVGSGSINSGLAFTVGSTAGARSPEALGVAPLLGSGDKTESPVPPVDDKTGDVDISELKSELAKVFFLP
jgi:hypothetical protein